MSRFSRDEPNLITQIFSRATELRSEVMFLLALLILLILLAGSGAVLLSPFIWILVAVLIIAAFASYGHIP